MASERGRDVRIAVVGAGILGLSAARAIAEEFRNVHIVAKGFGKHTCSYGAGGTCSLLSDPDERESEERRERG
jgi:glycine/D-amino acid oxidase-like deaminating enzyme